MAEKAVILFANDERMTEDTELAKYIKKSGLLFTTVWSEGTLYEVLQTPNRVNKERVRNIAGALARRLSERKVKVASVDAATFKFGLQELDKGEAIQAFVEGWQLGCYQFLTYKSKKTPFQTKLELVNFADVQSDVDQAKIRAEAVSLSRDLMNEVPNVLNPETFPEVIKEAFTGVDVDIRLYRHNDLEKMEMHGLLAVCRGSKYNPAFVELSYRGDETKPLVALVGKGVTFDTGGISLKSGRDLSDMRMDMGGAAAVVGAMNLLAQSQAKVNVVALIPLVENMPDNLALLPSEVIRYKNGVTVQVGNTDAEGRLILADGLIRAGELKAKYIVNIATLTGAVVQALGSKVAGVFGDEELSYVLKEIGENNGDRVWPMPLIDDYESYLKSDYADINNISCRSEAGSITAGLFLRHFVPKEAKWLHIDMAGVMETNRATGYYPKTATGYGARLLADFTTHISK